METVVPPQPAPGSGSIPGPVDRADFFEEQLRRRRQTWRFTLLCAIAAALVGVPLAMFVTPFLFFITLLLLRLLQAVVPVPQPVWSALQDFSMVVFGFLDAFAESPDPTAGGSLRDALSATRFVFGSPWLTLALLLVPSMVAVVLVWLGYRSLFRRAGIGGELLALGAREPNLQDLEERQLVNVVEEMALAAGLPPARVRMLDSPVPNAAVIGSGVDDAVIVVSRGLLDRMDRDETQGVIGHLVGSVGNGDTSIALSITTLFQTIELFFTAFDALINLSRSAWRDLLRVLRCALSGSRDAGAAAAVAALMDHRLGQWREDGVVGLMEDAQLDSPTTRTGRVIKRLPFLWVVLLPFALLYIPFLLLRMQIYLYRLAIVGPMVMLVWRTRRYLADATAVQLTRYPDGLARGLVRLAAEGAVMPGGQWFAHLFVVGPEAIKARGEEAFQRRMQELRERGGRLADLGTGGVAEALQVTREHAQQIQESEKETWSDELSGVASHPPLKKRLKRLESMGAAALMESARTRTRFVLPTSVRELGCLMVLFPLMALMLYLLVCVMVAVLLFSLIAATLFIGLAMPLVYRLVV